MRSRTRPSPRIARDVPMPKRGPDPKRSASHLAFVRSLPCAVCGAPPRSDACHIRAQTGGGIGLKPADSWTLPMCRRHHDEQHRTGETAFFAALGIDPYGLARHLWTHSGDTAAGERAVLRMVMEITARRMAG